MIKIRGSHLSFVKGAFEKGYVSVEREMRKDNSRNSTLAYSSLGYLVETVRESGWKGFFGTFVKDFILFYNRHYDNETIHRISDFLKYLTLDTEVKIVPPGEQDSICGLCCNQDTCNPVRVRVGDIKNLHAFGLKVGQTVRIRDLL